MSQPGGVLTRAGHTEAGCDLARLAGLEPASVIVEILNEDGSMARRPDLEKFAAQHHLKIGSIADLIEYRLRNEKSIERVGACEVRNEFGAFQLIAYQDHLDRLLHFALVRGEIGPGAPSLVRVHMSDRLGDVFRFERPGAPWPLQHAMRRVAREDNGVIVVLSTPHDAADLVKRMYNLHLADSGLKLPEHERDTDLRVYGIGAQILADLGVQKMRLLSTPKKIHGLAGFGLEVIEYVECD
jgi:3,4-dihydroxy 2-butanone 4-phosphate synthase/GTP cyclohydrolase II